MITYATEDQKQNVITLWKTAFPEDSDEFVNFYFEEKYHNEDTLLYFKDGKIVSSLQMLPYKMTYCEKRIKIAYVSGAATLPECQNQGLMRALLTHAFKEMKKRGEILTLLIPQEAWLVNFYQKSGYTSCFEHLSTPVYDGTSCFSAIFAFLELDDTHIKEVMARIVDVEKVLQIYASFYNQLKISIKVQDNQVVENNGIFCLFNGKCSRKQDVYFDMELNINHLTQLLLGNPSADSRLKSFQIG